MAYTYLELKKIVINIKLKQPQIIQSSSNMSEKRRVSESAFELSSCFKLFKSNCRSLSLFGTNFGYFCPFSKQFFWIRFQIAFLSSLIGNSYCLYSMKINLLWLEISLTLEMSCHVIVVSCFSTLQLCSMSWKMVCVTVEIYTVCSWNHAKMPFVLLTFLTLRF